MLWEHWEWTGSLGMLWERWGWAVLVLWDSWSPTEPCRASPAPHPPTHGHGVSGDVVPLAVLDDPLQVWAVVGLSICDDNHYSLCPFPAAFPKRFRAAREEMPWAGSAPPAPRCLCLPDLFKFWGFRGFF